MKIIYYYHIPKCGGTTISSQLKYFSEILGAEYYSFNCPMNQFNHEVKLANDTKIRHFFDGINDRTNDFKIVHHHHGFYGLGEIYDLLLQEKRNAILKGNQFYLFTCIRTPLSFQISRTNYLRNSCGMASFSFHDVCKDSKHQNFMSKYLLQNHPKRWNDLNLNREYFAEKLQAIDKIFSLEKLNYLYKWLEQHLEIPIQAPNLLVNAGSYSILPSGIQEKILENVNSLDQYFYDNISF